MVQQTTLDREVKNPLSGFTLAELLGVMAVIAILAGMILGIAGFAGRKAGEASCVTELEKWRNLMQGFHADKGYFPQGVSTNTLETLEDHITNTNSTSSAEFRQFISGYELDIDYDDPWGNGYIYSPKTRFTYTIGSKGPDGKYGDNSGSSSDFGKFDDITNENGRLN